MSDIWSYRETSWSEDLTGYDVEATDGWIGKIDEASNETAAPTWSSTPGSGSSARSA